MTKLFKLDPVTELYGELVWQMERSDPDPKILADIGLSALVLEYEATDDLELEYLNRIWQEASYGIRAAEEGWAPYDPNHPPRFINVGPY